VDIGNIIYTKRKEKGLSQEQLAEAIGVARQTVSKWETSETLPDVESLQKLAIFLGFSVDKALGIDTGLIEEDDDDDKTVWLMIGGFAIGTVLGIAFEKYILGLAFAIVGQGLGLILKAFDKKS